MRFFLLILLTCISVFSCVEKQAQESLFLTKLGNDTLAIERFLIDPDSLTADVVLRSPRTSLRRYQMSWDKQQRISELVVTDFTSVNSFNAGNGEIIQKYTSEGDSLRMISFGTANDQARKIPNRSELIPFIDMVHWPFELAFNRASKSKIDSINQYMLTGRRVSNFIIHRVNDGFYTLRHPSRGVMEVNTGQKGELLSLDAAQTTRKLKVERGFDLSFDVLATRFAENDKINSPFGTLSPAVTNEYFFKNSRFEVNYGSPLKRGRDIFGGIVPYDQRWRTGANRATHFKTSRDLYLNGKRLPAGEYTLFTIPEPSGGTLIINSQTGQNGQSYDQSRDFMRVPMQKAESNSTVEAFTIVINETSSGGQLQLMWDRTIFFVDFTF